MPSSITRLVEANIKATAATKCAPFSNKDRAVARAAKEHEEDIAPNNVDKERLLKSRAPMYGVNRRLETKAWIIALTKYPSTKAQPAFQKNPKAVFAASP